MRILVTGATGYLGRAIVAAAAQRGHEPVAFARRARAAGLSCAAIDGDVRDRAALDAAAAGCDAICHTAALVAVWRPRREEFDEVNVGGLRHVLDVAQARGITRVAYTSSFIARPPRGRSEPGDWNDYQRTKVAADRLAGAAIERGAPLMRLYPGVIYGPGTLTEGNLVGRMLADHLAGRLPGLIGPERTWSFAHVDDVAAAHVVALERGSPGASYELGGENRPQISVFELLREATGRKLPRRIPAPVARAAAAVEELLAASFGRVPQLTRGTVTILEHDWPLGHDRAAAELAYRVTPLADAFPAVLASLGATRA
jgi:NAD+-dependent farnesol dehydrogenase